MSENFSIFIRYVASEKSWSFCRCFGKIPNCVSIFSANPSKKSSKIYQFRHLGNFSKIFSFSSSSVKILASTRYVSGQFSFSRRYASNRSAFPCWHASAFFSSFYRYAAAQLWPTAPTKIFWFLRWWILGDSVCCVDKKNATYPSYWLKIHLLSKN